MQGKQYSPIALETPGVAHTLCMPGSARRGVIPLPPEKHINEGSFFIGSDCASLRRARLRG